MLLVYIAAAMSICLSIFSSFLAILGLKVLLQIRDAVIASAVMEATINEMAANQLATARVLVELKNAILVKSKNLHIN